MSADAPFGLPSLQEQAEPHAGQCPQDDDYQKFESSPYRSLPWIWAELASLVPTRAGSL